MAVDITWPSETRTLHLLGGLRVEETKPGFARIGPMPGNDIEISFCNFVDLENAVHQRIGLQVLGVERFRSVDELIGLAAAEWQPIGASRPIESPIRISEINWSGLSTAACKRNDSKLYRIAGSITSQCRFVSVRLLDLSNIYLKNIDAILKDTKKISERLVRGYFIDSLFSAIHASFSEMATLRDYFAEYIAYSIYKDDKIDSFNDLYKKINRKNTPLELEIDNIYCKPSGWLYQFSERRNTLTHRMPIDRLSGGGFMHVRQHAILTGESIWILHIPVPEPVGNKHKSTFILPSSAMQHGKDQVEDLIQAASRQDSLSYLFEIFGLLVDFGNRLVKTFPYPPEMFTLTDADIISAKFET